MSWKTVCIGDICSLSTGGTPSRTHPEYFDNGKINWLVSGDINKREIFECDGKITELGFKNSNAKYLPVNSVLIALNGQGKTRGSVAILRIEATCNQSLVAINPKNKDDLDTKYLFYYLDSKYEEIRKLTGDSGNDRRGLNMPLIRKIKINVPHIATQTKIVAKLEAIIAEIDRATAATEASAKNAEALFQSYLKTAFDVEGDWTETTLGKSFELYQPQTITTKDLIDGGTYQVYGANGVIGRYDKYNHEEPQLLITCRGATCGTVNVSSPFAWINGNAMVVKPKTKDIDVRFTEYFFRGAVDLTKAITGAAQPQITRQSLSPIFFNYPSVAIQQKIVAKLDAVSAELIKLAHSYKIKSNELNFLKQSILKKAFNGELVKE